MRVFPRVDRIAPRLPLEKSYSALIATPFGWSRAASRNQPPWKDRTRTPLHAATVCTLCIRVKNVFADLRRGRQLHLSTKSDPNRRKHHGRLAIKRHADVTRVARRLPSPTTVPNQAPRAARAVATAGVDRRCLAPARERRMACASSSRTSSSISAAPKTRRRRRIQTQCGGDSQLVALQLGSSTSIGMNNVTHPPRTQHAPVRGSLRALDLGIGALQ
jgi:hypothetical protein